MALNPDFGTDTGVALVPGRVFVEAFAASVTAFLMLRALTVLSRGNEREWYGQIYFMEIRGPTQEPLGRTPFKKISPDRSYWSMAGNGERSRSIPTRLPETCKHLFRLYRKNIIRVRNYELFQDLRTLRN